MDRGERSLLHSAGSTSPPPMTTIDAQNGVLGKIRDAWKKATKGTVISSIFILLTTCIGAGTLSLPYAFSQGGIFVFSIIFFLIMLMSLYVGSMLLSSKRYCTEVYPGMEVWSYEDLAYASFGVLGRIASLLTIAILLFLALIAYMIYTRDQLAAVMQYIVNKKGLDECSPLLNCGILMCIAFLPIFPVTLLRKLTPLQFTSYVSVSSIILVAIFIMVRTIMAHADSSSTYLPDPDMRRINLVPKDFSGVLTVISYCSLSFICHFNLLPLQKELAGRQTKAKLYGIIFGALLTAYAVYNLVIFSAYFNFYECIKPDVMTNYQIDDLTMMIARAFLCVTILMHYPVLLHPTRANINGAIYLIFKGTSAQIKRFSSRHLQSEEKPLVEKSSNYVNTEFKVPTIPWFLETLAIFCATFILATFIEDVGLVWNFVGSTAGVLTLYVYPAAFYLRLRYVRYRSRIHNRSDVINMRSQYDVYAILKEVAAWLIFGIGLVLLVVENYQAIDAVVHSGGGGGANDTCANSNTSSTAGHCYILSCNSSSNSSDDVGYGLFYDYI